MVANCVHIEQASEVKTFGNKLNCMKGKLCPEQTNEFLLLFVYWLFILSLNANTKQKTKQKKQYNPLVREIVLHISATRL